MKKSTIMTLILLFLTQESKAVSTLTNSLVVTANVPVSCTITGGTIAFGSYIPTATTDMTATGSINVRCTNQTAYHVRMDKGLGGSNTSSRAMVGATGNLPYNLFRDSARTQNWGEVDGTDSLADTGTGSSKTHTVYATLPAGANVPGGAYADTVTVTLAY